MIYNPYDYYFNKAKQEWYKARSAFKLEEMQDKFKLIDKNTKTILDIGCAPWSWMQYSYTLLNKFNVKNGKIIWFDIQDSTVNLPNVYTYVQDVTDVEKIDEILRSHQIIPCCHYMWDEEATVHKMDSSTSLHSVSEWQLGAHWKWQGGVDFIQSDMAPNIQKISQTRLKICYQSIYVTRIWRVCSHTQKRILNKKYQNI